MVTIESTAFAGWDDCLRLSNGALELVCTTQVGPRVVHVGPEGGPNLCYLDDDAGSLPADDEWRLFGGHRLWHAPEVGERSKRPDNDPVGVNRHNDVVTLTQPAEPRTDVRKELTVRLAPEEPRATVTHRVVNEGAWPIELSPWGITVMEPGGTAVLPTSQSAGGRQADRTISLWPYTELGDERLDLVDGAVLVTGEERDADPAKVGVDGGDGWAAYVLDGYALRKEFVRREDASYPDRGAAAQVFTDGHMLELETLGPLETVGPNESTAHVEEWTLLDDVDDVLDGAEPDLEALAP